MVAGLEEISKGTVSIGDREVNNVPPKDRDIAMVFQNYALYPHMTVRDNMAFGLKLRKFPKAEIKKRVEEASSILGLDPYLDRKPKALSGGQRQRVAMGRAIVREPSVFLFDEPLSNLDAKMRVEMRREILQLHKRISTTMIYVTHDQVEAMTLGDRICIMRDGIIEQVGEPTLIFDNPASLFVAKFIGSPPMNILKGSLKKEGEQTVFDGGSLQASLPPEKAAMVHAYIGKEVYLGLRPKAFALKAHSPEGALSFSCKVSVSEMLGEEILAHLQNGDHELTVSIDPHHKIDLDGEIEVCPDMTRAHVFAADSEINLTMPK